MSDSQQSGLGPGQPYDRPNQKFKCGRAALWGKPCDRGPNHDGSCGGTVGCAPARKGDRFVCQRLPCFGGPCAEGPDDEGKCSLCLPACAPRPVLRVIRGRLTIAALALVAIFIALGFPFGNRQSSGTTASVNPGPLSAKHASFFGASNCEQCHSVHAAQGAGWLKAAFVKTDLSESCSRCHAFAGAATQPHNSKFATRPDAPSIGCTACHTEHHGVKAPITTITEAQCHSCHTVKFNHFDRDHPAFPATFPHSGANTIKFDHRSHLVVHFRDPKYVRDAPANCAGCHAISPGARAVAIPSFEKACARCHADNIPANDFVLLRLPEDAKSISVSDATEFMGLALGGADARAYSTNTARLIAGLAKQAASPLRTLLTNQLPAAPAAALLAGLNADLLAPAASAWLKGQKLETQNQKSPTGWYWLEDQLLELHYRPAFHSDPVLRAWIDFSLATSARLTNSPTSAAASKLRALLVDPRNGPGRCFKCHGVREEHDSIGHVFQAAGWQAGDGSRHPQTLFSHGEHVGFESCTYCHKIIDKPVPAPPSPSARADASKPAPTSSPSNFHSISKETCVDCHNQKQVRQDCSLCHQYHNGPSLRTPSARMLTGGAGFPSSDLLPVKGLPASATALSPKK